MAFREWAKNKSHESMLRAKLKDLTLHEDSLSSLHMDEKTNTRDLAGSCTKTTVDFSKDAKGNLLERGKYVSDEWKALGLTLSSSGGYGTRPRIFDTSDPGNKDHGDPDLGTPNERCPGGGPGWGEGGEPDMPGANCEFLGNVLIIQEDNDDKTIPDDNVDGGEIEFRFSNAGQTVYEIGLLDVDCETSILVDYYADTGLKQASFDIPILGDNSVQTFAINLPKVIRLKLIMSRSAAVTFISFCPTSGVDSPPPPPPHRHKDASMR